MNKSAIITMSIAVNDNGEDNFSKHLPKIILNSLQYNKYVDVKDIIAVTLSGDNQKSLLYENLEEIERIYILKSSDYKTELEKQIVRKIIPLLCLFGKEWIPKLNKLLKGLYVLNDSHQEELLEIVKIYLKRNTVQERVDEVSKLKRWRKC